MQHAVIRILWVTVFVEVRNCRMPLEQPFNLPLAIKPNDFG
jgi:hypothetical protein